MPAAVAVGAFSDMEGCIARWESPTLREALDPDLDLPWRYAALVPANLTARCASPPVWEVRAGVRSGAADDR